MNFKRNIFLFYVYETFREPLIIGPIITLYYLNKGLSFSNIMILQTVFAISIVLCDVPTGIIADKISRKSCIIIGLLIQLVGFLILILSNKLYLFALSEFLSGLGTSFKSGSNTALLFDYLLKNEKEKDYVKISSNGQTLQRLIPGGLTILSGFLYSYSKNLPIVIGMSMLAIAGSFIAFFEEKISVKTGRFTIKNYLHQMMESSSYVIRHAKLRAIFTFSIPMLGLTTTVFWFYQPYMKITGISEEYFGIIYFFFNISCAFSTYFTDLYIKSTKGKTLFILSAMVSVSLILMGITKAWFGFAFIFIQQFVRGVLPITLNKYLNKYIQSDNRATILSLNSMAGNIFKSVLSILIAVLVDLTDIFSSQLIIGIFLLFITCLINSHLNRVFRKD